MPQRGVKPKQLEFFHWYSIFRLGCKIKSVQLFSNSVILEYCMIPALVPVIHAPYPRYNVTNLLGNICTAWMNESLTTNFSHQCISKISFSHFLPQITQVRAVCSNRGFVFAQFPRLKFTRCRLTIAMLICEHVLHPLRT